MGIKKGFFMSINLKDIWPQEKDFIIKPERYKYVRRLVEPQTCVFCSAISKGVSFESLLLYKGKQAHVIINKYPYNSGHILVIMNEHKGDLSEISLEAHLEAMTLLKESVKILKETYQCQGLNVGLNHGQVAGAGIPDHLHWHIIPRWSGDTNFFPLIAETKVLPESIEQTYEKLRPKFKALSI